MATPKQQQYPSSKIFVGAVLYIAMAWTDDDGKTTSEIEQWVVRSIRAKRGSKTKYGFKVAASRAYDVAQYVNLTQKIDRITWGKRSTKNGDYGWLSSIPESFRMQFRVGDPLPYGLYTTERAALVYRIAAEKEWLAKVKLRDDALEIETAEAELSALKRRLARLKPKQPKTING